MRLFIAVWVDEPVREKIRGFLEEMASQAQGVKWTPPQQLHFTLKFLGDHRRELVKELSPLCREVGRSHKKFRLSLAGGGVFPSWTTPRLLWLGTQEGTKDLRALAEKIEDMGRQKGLPAEKRAFKPHLTIGRVKGADPSFNRLLLETGVPGEMVVSGFSLVVSILTPQGPVYQEVEEFTLG